MNRKSLISAYSGSVAALLMGALALDLRLADEEFGIRAELPEQNVTVSEQPEPEWVMNGISKKSLAVALSSATQASAALPSDVQLEVNGRDERVIVQYALDEALQTNISELYRQYSPDYGAFVAVDAATGRVLAMVSHHRGVRRVADNLALKATFPSASVFKVVTAAAAIAERNYHAGTVIPYNGKNHTLYRSHVLKDRHTRWTRYITLREAFARSVNTVFAKIGIFALGQDRLARFAEKFGFNKEIGSDLPMDQARAEISADDWELAEAASGFTQENTMSPLHGALIAAAVVNQGRMMEPYVVQSIHRDDGTVLYEAKPRLASSVVDERTASEVRELMRGTIERGTSSKQFRGFFRSRFGGVDVGGKTGSLTGTDPKGKYDWFVGYGEYQGRKIALAALTVNEKVWRVKSSTIARRAIETYFKSSLPEKLKQRVAYRPPSRRAAQAQVQ